MRRLLALYLGGIAVAVGLLGLVLYIQAERARADVDEAVSNLDSVRDALSMDSLQDDAAGIVARLDAAAAQLRSAREHLATPFLAPARALPFVGRQARAAIALCDGATGLVEAGADAVRRAAPLFRDASPDSVIVTLDRLKAVFDDFLRGVDAVRLPRASELIGPLRSATLRLEDIRAKARARAGGIADLLPHLRSMLGGDGARRYFLGVNNNAEMRGAGGMMLSFGILTFDQGRFRLGPVASTNEVVLNPDAASGIDMPPEYEDVFGWMRPTLDFRNTTVSAVFPQVGELVSRMYRARTGQTVDRVITIDVVALAAIVDEIGPVDVPAISATLTGDNTIDVVLSEVYRTFRDDQVGRQAALGIAAAQVAARLAAPGAPAVAVAGRLADLVPRRHLMAWSARPPEQAALAQAGLSGDLPTDRFPILPAVQNISANKMDYYVEPAVALSLRMDGLSITGEITITVANRTPLDEGLPQYVVGANEGQDRPPGEYGALVTTWLPIGSAILGVRGDGIELRRGRDAGFTLSEVALTVPAREERVVTVVFALLLDHDATRFPLAVLPQGRVQDVIVSLLADLGTGWNGSPAEVRPLNAPIVQDWVWHRPRQ